MKLKRTIVKETIMQDKLLTVKEFASVPVWSVCTLSSKCDLCGFKLWEHQTVQVTALLLENNGRAIIHSSCLKRLEA